MKQVHGVTSESRLIVAVAKRHESICNSLVWKYETEQDFHLELQWIKSQHKDEIIRPAVDNVFATNSDLNLSMPKYLLVSVQ